MTEQEQDWKQRALEAEQALGIERSENEIMRSELKRIYDDHFSGLNCRLQAKWGEMKLFTLGGRGWCKHCGFRLKDKRKTSCSQCKKGIREMGERRWLKTLECEIIAQL